LLRYTKSEFKTDHNPTLGVEFASKQATIGQDIVKVQVWDTVRKFFKRVDFVRLVKNHSDL